MLQMKRTEKMKLAKVGKRKVKGLRLRSRAQVKRNNYHVTIITEKGEKLTYRITRKRGIYKINKKGGALYTHAKVVGDLRVNSRIALYSNEGVVVGTIKKITALDPSTDVEPGNIPPIKKPGGH